MKKKISEHTDRELMEKIAIHSKTTADATVFIKNFLVVAIIITIICALLIVFR